MSAPVTAAREITPGFIDDVCGRLANGLQVRRALPDQGRLHIDRQLPFLLVYRERRDAHARGTDRLVTSEASYMIAPAGKQHHTAVAQLLERIVATLSPEFGAFLVLELWPAEAGSKNNRGTQPTAGFRIVSSKAGGAAATVEKLFEALEKIRIHGRSAVVESATAAKVAPPGLPPLLGVPALGRHRAVLLGLQVEPVYASAEDNQLYPIVLQRLRRQLSRALQQGLYEFTVQQTTHTPPHYQALGRNAVSKAVWDIDERLATISQSFDFLLQVTPNNITEAWKEFRRRKFQQPPVFTYRRIPIDPELMKRGLFNIQIEQIEDPTLAHLFRERQEEIDRQITMLRDRGSWRFVHGSIQLYGGVRDGLLETARDLLAHLPKRSRERSTEALTAAEFVDAAREEYRYYRSIFPGFQSDAEIRSDIGQTLMVSSGKLLIGKDTKIPKARANALLQHEVGTHVLTYCNGHTQPLQQLYCGLAGYDEFQEGIAVLAEHLVGGLSPSRLRVIAARVVAVHAMIERASFVDVFRMLNRDYGFSQYSAFTITMRIFRGGGLTKDAIYLRGLITVLRYLRDGGELEPLFVGKIAAHHVPIIRELQHRNVLNPAPLLPRYMNDEEVRLRLERIRNGMSVQKLVN